MHQKPARLVHNGELRETRIVILRHACRLHDIGNGRTHARTHVILLIEDLDVRLAPPTTGDSPSTTSRRNDKTVNLWVHGVAGLSRDHVAVEVGFEPVVRRGGFPSS